MFNAEVSTPKNPIFFPIPFKMCQAGKARKERKLRKRKQQIPSKIRLNLP
jgi:hypothetical protein